MKGRKKKLSEGKAPAERCPGPPTWLSLHAKREWKRSAPQLHKRGLLAPETLGTLESYCLAVGLVREHHDTLAREGQLVEGKAHPSIKVMLAMLREARLLAAELALTPHRRGDAGGTEDKDDGWGDDLLPT